ncbi:hypothetical protein ABZ771_35495 [Streptomyces globisporus]|uniref:hypothetical protein n=1 Tax=Streptomyces globisporus TaxID=1908 RepID=UPI000E2BD20F|nr:hypothetical protein [Streptomyces sp. HB202]RDL06837.1 hypothetical protein DER30_0100 [Streptomyces sp. HB202]WSV87852.1 hypothetical protein OG449_00215 [Streptomyces globisporus]
MRAERIEMICTPLTWHDARMETGFPWGSAPTVDLSLWRADAIVLFDWLMSTDLNAVPITHPAQKQALADLLARLEEVDITESTEEEIAAAQEEVAKDMGW